MEATCRGGSAAGDWRRATHGCAAAASQTGCLTEPRSQSPAALTPRPKPVPTGIVHRRTLTPPPCSAPHCPRLQRGRTETRVAGAQPVHWCPTVTGASNHALLACSRFPGHGSDVPRRQRGRGLAESGTRMCRGGESDRMSDRAEEPVPGRAAAPTEARERQRAWRCPENPYLTPNPRKRAPARACGAGAPRHARPWRASCASSPRRERG
ncbi:hypothetical protein GGR60_003323 [Xanthomonas arboricola]|nr:hypothetical protein [Xanthomonas euroxanthea]